MQEFITNFLSYGVAFLGSSVAFSLHFPDTAVFIRLFIKSHDKFMPT